MTSPRIVPALVWLTSLVVWFGAPIGAADAVETRLAIDRELSRASQAHSTLVVLVRHAEKRAIADDPGLTRRGRRRAARLARLLRDHDVDRLFASEYRRTQRTLAPLERRTGQLVDIRPARAIEDLARELRALAHGSLVVVAGHSNTVPAIARALGAAPELRELPDDAYDRLWLVTLPPPGGAARLVELRFDP